MMTNYIYIFNTHVGKPYKLCFIVQLINILVKRGHGFKWNDKLEKGIYIYIYSTPIFISLAFIDLFLMGWSQWCHPSLGNKFKSNSDFKEQTIRELKETIPINIQRKAKRMRVGTSCLVLQKWKFIWL